MDDPAEVCRQIYAETKRFYETQISGSCSLGFKILYGPPIPHSELLFLGYQPGGGLQDYEREARGGAHEQWPPICEYSYEKWALAKAMQKMFGISRLKKSVGLNAIFIRAPNVDCYKKSVPISVRKTIDQFCLPRAEKIIAAINPSRIVVIGFDTLRLFGNERSDLMNEKGRVLTRLGEIAGHKAIATLHLSGAQISNVDRASITQRILAC